MSSKAAGVARLHGCTAGCTSNRGSLSILNRWIHQAKQRESPFGAAAGRERWGARGAQAKQRDSSFGAAAGRERWGARGARGAQAKQRESSFGAAAGRERWGARGAQAKQRESSFGTAAGRERWGARVTADHVNDTIRIPLFILLLNPT